MDAGEAIADAIYYVKERVSISDYMQALREGGDGIEGAREEGEGGDDIVGESRQLVIGVGQQPGHNSKQRQQDRGT